MEKEDHKFTALNLAKYNLCSSHPVENEAWMCMSLSKQKLNDALIISEDARIKDALAYLKEFFTNVKNGPYTELEKQLTAKFQGISHNTCDSCRGEESLW